MTVHRLREIRLGIFPNIFFLMETKNNDEFVINTFAWMGYSSHFLVSPHAPEAGGLLLFWKQEIEV